MLMFKPDELPAVTEPRLLHLVQVSLVVISAHEDRIWILTPSNGAGLPSAPLVTTLEEAIRQIISSFAMHAGREDLLKESLRQLSEDVERIAATERIFGRAEDKSKQAMLAEEIRRLEQTIQQLRHAQETEEDIGHLVPLAIKKKFAIYKPEEGFPVILSEAILEEGRLELVFVAGAAILGQREPRQGVAAWQPYPTADEGVSIRSGKIQNAVGNFISPIGSKSTRTEEGLMRAFTLNKDPTFSAEGMKRSLSLLTGESVTTLASLVKNLAGLFTIEQTVDYSNGMRVQGLKPVKREPRQTSPSGSGPAERQSVIPRIIFKYSAIPDLRVAIIKESIETEAAQQSTLHSRRSETQRLFDLSLTDPVARQVIDGLLTAQEEGPGATPGRNVMTLSWRKREKEFFIRSMADHAKLQSVLSMIPGEEHSVEEQDRARAEQRASTLADQKFERISRPGVCAIWSKAVAVSSTEPLKTELLVTTGRRGQMSQAADQEAAVREATAILHTIALLSRDAYETQAGTDPHGKPR